MSGRLGRRLMDGMLKRFGAVIGLAGLSGLAGAGCARSAGQQNVKALEKRVAELVQREAENNRRIEDLNTRLFLLEDKLEPRAESSAGEGAAEGDDVEHLPVVRLKPRHITSGQTGEDRPRQGRRDRLPPDEPDEGMTDEGAADVADAARAGERVEGARPGAEGTHSLVAAHDVAYGGAALRTGPRPILKLRGERERDLPAAIGEIDGFGERLPVVPLASRGVAEALASAAPRAKQDDVAATYRNALVLYRERRLPQAVGAFRQVIDKHPEHEFADNAMYWLAECFYDLKQYAAALELFKRVVAEHPRGNKAPDALLKVGYSYLRLQQPEKGRAVLMQVRSKYPALPAGKLATTVLSELAGNRP